MPPSPHIHPVISRADNKSASATSVPRVTGEVLILKEKVAALEAWRASTEADLKEIRDVISQVKLLITLSLGGGGLSIITLIITISRLINP
jgi:hypothetical protein